MRSHLRAIAAATCALVLCAVCAVAHSDVLSTPSARSALTRDVGKQSVAAVRPAIWRTYDMIVDFQNLPRTYTCDELWYEFHGILLRLGAPLASINILPYHCSPSPSGYMRSPHVQVQFQLPFVVQPGVSGAPIKAVERTVRLSPGKPKTLHASDCQLLEQIDNTLLASLPARVDAAHFDCSAPASRGRFAATVSLPVLARARTVVARAPSRARQFQRSQHGSIATTQPSANLRRS